MDADMLAQEIAALISAMGKGPYLVLCAALNASGGEVVIDAGELSRDAMRLPPRVEVAIDERGIVVRINSLG